MKQKHVFNGWFHVVGRDALGAPGLGVDHATARRIIHECEYITV